MTNNTTLSPLGLATFGVRSVVSTWAFLKGLNENDCATKRLYCVDIDDVPRMREIIPEVKKYGIELTFIQQDSAKVELKPVDLLFIDTWHIYGHLKRELAAEGIRCGLDSQQIAEVAAKVGYPANEVNRGLKPAIDEFLAAHPEWTLHKVYTNNNGLTILKRR